MGRFFMLGAPAPVVTGRLFNVFNSAATQTISLNPTSIGANIGDTMIVFAMWAVNNGLQSMAATSGWTAMMPTGVNGANNFAGGCVGVWWKKFSGSVPGATSFGLTSGAATGVVTYGYAVITTTLSPTNFFFGDGVSKPSTTGTLATPLFGNAYSTPMIAFACDPFAGVSETSFAFSGLDNIHSLNASANGCASIGTALASDFPNATLTTNNIARNAISNFAVSLGDPGITVPALGATSNGSTSSIAVNFGAPAVAAQSGDMIIAMVMTGSPNVLSSVSSTYGTWVINAGSAITGGAFNENVYIASTVLTSTPPNPGNITFTTSGAGLTLGYWVIRNFPANIAVARTLGIQAGPFSNSTGPVAPSTISTALPGTICLDFATAVNTGTGETATYNQTNWRGFAVDPSSVNGWYTTIGWRKLADVVSSSTVVSTVFRERDFATGSIFL